MIGTSAAQQRRGLRSLGLATIVTLSVLVAGCTSTSDAASPGGGTSSTVPGESAAAIDSTAPNESTTPNDSSAPTGLTTITAADLPPLAAAEPPPSGGPQRIVSLATGVGETLVAFGVGDRVVGRDETSEEPAGAEVVTKAHEVSAERVIALDPDLVIVDARTSPPEALDQIRAAGIEVIEVPEAWTLTDMPPRIAAIASAVGADPAPVLAQVPAAPALPNATAPRVAFLYLRGTSAIYLLGGAGSGADAMIEAAGGIDVGAEAGFDPFVPLTAEALAQLNPDVLLVMTKGMESVNGIDGLLALPGVAQTSAGREGRVIAVEDEILLSFGPRTGSLITLLRQALGT